MDILALLNSIAGIVMLIMVVVMFVFLWQLSRLKDQLRQIKKNYQTLTRGVDGADIDSILRQIVEEADANAVVLADHQELMKNINSRLNAALNRVAIVHYNAFDFAYGELSFSMAVLDDLGTGFVFTNIHNRDDARCYCKRITNGETKYPLSEEEKEVLEQALNHGPTYSRQKRNES